MEPKMTAKDAAKFLGVSEREVKKRLIQLGLPFIKERSTYHFDHLTARHLFNIRQPAKVIAFQIVKGGTGKTSLAFSLAVRANLYGLKVLCIDLDQQGNLTQSFGIDANKYPVMIDILADNYPIKDSIINLYPGMALISSRIENSILDDVIQAKRIGLDKIFTRYFSKLSQDFDLIIVDCPPNLGQSVAAVALASDLIVSPVVPGQYAISGLKNTYSAILELQDLYNLELPWRIVLNKFDNTQLAKDTLQMLLNNPSYKNNFLLSYIRVSSEISDVIEKGGTLFDTLKTSGAKKDVDEFTQELLGVMKFYSKRMMKIYKEASLAY